jgi:predicted ATPase
MPVDAFRVQNFMGFVDSGWIEIRPLTLLFGRNSSGKSAILRALLLLQQSLESPPNFGPLLFVDEEGLDFGGYREMVYNHEMDRKIIFTFRHRFTDHKLRDFYRDDVEAEHIPIHQQEPNTASYALIDALTKLVDPNWTELESPHIYLQSELLFRAGEQPGQAEFYGLTLRNGDEHPNDTISKKESERIIEITRSTPSKEMTSHISNQWDLASDYLGDDEFKNSEWGYVVVTNKTGFFPYLQISDKYFDPAQQAIEAGSDTRDPRDISGTAGSLLRLLSILYPDPEIRNFLNLTYLGPLRPEPLRYYYVAGQGRTNRIRNRVIQSVIEAKQNAHSAYAQKLERIQEWLKNSLKTTFDVLPIEPASDGITSKKNLYEIVFQEVTGKDESAAKGVTAGIREVGSGLSQVLPVLIEALFAPAGTIVIIEQPELHLHPKAQAELGDLLIEATRHSIRLLIETHSEHLLLRLQKQVAKTTVGEIPAENPLQMLLLNQLSIYFTNRKEGVSTVTEIEVSSLGDLMNTPEGFDEFFSDDMRETAERMHVRLLGKRRGL